MKNKNPYQQKKIRYTKTPLRKSVILNVCFIFLPGFLVWILLGDDVTIFGQLPTYLAFIIASTLLVYSIVLAVLLVFFKATEPDQILFFTTLMAVLMSAYLTSFSGWQWVIRALLTIAVLIIVGFITNGIANVWSDKRQAAEKLIRLTKLNKQQQQLEGIDPKKLDSDLLAFFNIKLQQDKEPAKSDPAEANKALTEEEKEIKKLQEIKLDE